MGVASIRTKGSRFKSASKARTFQSPLDKARGFELVWSQVSPLFEAGRHVRDAKYVYFIGEYDEDENDGPVKIGAATNPVDRLRSMQTGNPRRLRIEHVLLGDMALEKLMHELWEPFAIKSAAKRAKPASSPGTEWFTADIRPKLWPILDTAAAKQIKFLRGRTENIAPVEVENLVREAHAEHDFVFRKREPILLMAQGSGYVNLARQSRL